MKRLIGIGTMIGIATTWSALGGGCSSPPNGNTSTGDSGLPSSPTDSGIGNHPDTGAGGPQTCPSDTAPTAAQVENPTSGTGAWQPPTAAPGACSAADKAALISNFASSSITTWSGMKAGVSAGCVSCFFTDVDEANPSATTHWGPIVVLKKADAETGGLDNVPGACLAVVQSSACGKAEFDFAHCVDTMCLGCSDQSSFDACTADASGALQTACSAAFTADVNAGCGSTAAYTAAVARCSNDASKPTLADVVGATVDLVCGSGPSDAGTDG